MGRCYGDCLAARRRLRRLDGGKATMGCPLCCLQGGGSAVLGMGGFGEVGVGAHSGMSWATWKRAVRGGACSHRAALRHEVVRARSIMPRHRRKSLSISSVIRIARLWVTGMRKCAIVASKSSMKQATALGSSAS